MGTTRIEKSVKRIVVVSDVQVPYQSNRQVNALAAFIRGFKPDDVYSVGDHFDLPMVSRWTRNRRGEFDGSIRNHIDEGRRILEKLQVRQLKVGNHDIRVERYVENYAPALSPLQELRMENLFGLGELGVTLHRDPWEFAPGWVIAHGDEGALSQKPGQTAFNLASKWGKSVVCSHTHRQGHIVNGIGFAGEINSHIHGVEVGCLMEVSQAHYLRAGASNWTPGFAILDISNNRVQPQLIQMSKTGGFIFEGRYFEDGKVRSRKFADAPGVKAGRK